MAHESTIKADIELDASGLNCPLPILKAKKAMHELSDHQVLCVISTDPGSKREFEMFAQQTNYVMLAIDEAAGKTFFYLQKTLVESATDAF